MRLVYKLNLALVLAVGGVLVVQAKQRVDREQALFDDETRRDHRGMGRSLGAVLSEVWEQEGSERALELVSRVDQRDAVTHIRWVWLDGADEEYRALAEGADLGPAGEGRIVYFVGPEDSGTLYTYVPVAVPGPRRAALELSESLAPQVAYLDASLRRVAMYNLALLVVASALVASTSGWFVSRPIRRLIAQARRVGAGDLGQRVAVPQKDEMGELAREMNAMTDQLVVARERIEAEMAAKAAALDQLRHADRLMSVGQLASGVAHELGTPLNVVGVRAKMIQTGEVTGAEVIDNARIIKEQADRMTSIIRSLLDFARPRAGTRVPVDVASLARQTTVLLQPIARKHQVRIESVEGEDIQALADPSQIQQVILNLAVNGIEAMPEGGRLRMRVDSESVTPPAGLGIAPGRFTRLVVEDEGTGIPAEHLDKVFEPFFTTKDVGKGTGLGLSVSWGIVRDHGGFVSFENRPEGGARFTVHLPEAP